MEAPPSNPAAAVPPQLLLVWESFVHSQLAAGRTDVGSMVEQLLGLYYERSRADLRPMQAELDSLKRTHAAALTALRAHPVQLASDPTFALLQAEMQQLTHALVAQQQRLEEARQRLSSHVRALSAPLYVLGNQLLKRFRGPLVGVKPAAPSRPLPMPSFNSVGQRPASPFLPYRLWLACKFSLLESWARWHR